MLDKNKVEKFIAAAMKYKGDKYSQPKRMQKGYSDCSSLIYKGLRDAGLLDLSRTTKTISTRYMRDGDPRFERIGMNQLQRGDILWWQKPGVSHYEGHVAIFLGSGRVLEAIYEGVVEKSSTRILYQRAYRIKTLKSTAPTKPIKVEPLTEQGTVTVTALNVRTGPGTNYNKIGQLRKSAAVNITGQAEGWYQIRYQNKPAYVSGEYIKIKKPEVIRNVPIVINGQEVKKGYIVNGTTFMNVAGKDRPVRKVFEDIGADVNWEDGKVKIIL